MKIVDILKASVIPIILAVVVYLIYLGASLGAGHFLQGDPALNLIFILLMCVFYLANLAIFILAGFLAGRKSGASAVEGGAVSAVAFAVSHTIVTLISLLVMGIIYGTIAGAATAKQTTETAIFLGALGAVSLVMTITMYVITLFIGLLINFLAGAFGAYIVSRKVA